MACGNHRQALIEGLPSRFCVPLYERGYSRVCGFSRRDISFPVPHGELDPRFADDDSLLLIVHQDAGAIAPLPILIQPLMRTSSQHTGLSSEGA